MKRESYASLEEWKSDYIRVQEHPNDSHLVSYVIKCIKNSSNIIQEQIKNYLSNIALETNPWMVLKELSKQFPDHFVMVRTAEDPWFKV